MLAKADPFVLKAYGNPLFFVLRELILPAIRITYAMEIA